MFSEPKAATVRLFIREAIHAIVAWTTLVLVVVWMVLCQEWSDMRWWAREVENSSLGEGPQGRLNPKQPPPQLKAYPLQDVVLEHLPYYDKGWVSDLLVNSSAGIAVIGCLILARGWQAKIICIRRVAWMMAILYLLRSITISVTTLPPSISNCVPVVPQTISGLFKTIPGMLTGKVAECTDKIFSGHTVILCMSFLLWTRYATHWGFILYSTIHTLLGILSVLIVRYHYTVDVVLAILLTYFVNHVYFTSLESAIRYRALSNWNMSPFAKQYSGSFCYDQLNREEDCTEYSSPQVTAASPGDSDDITVLFARPSMDDQGNECSSVHQGRTQCPDTTIEKQQQHILQNGKRLSISPHLGTEPLSMQRRLIMAHDSRCSKSGSCISDPEKSSRMYAPDEAAPEMFYYRPRLIGEGDEQFDAMAINRRLSYSLPAVVAWMDGLSMR